jgi:RNA polymerase sigma-70 factor (ECF subfamily)
VITLHYLEDYSVEETAKLLGLSVSGVKMRLSRGREKLKNIMEGYTDDC